MKTKYNLALILLLPLGYLAQAQTMRWIPSPQQSSFGNCMDQSSKSGVVKCYVLEYTPNVSGVLTSYTTGFLVSCTSLGSPITKNQSCAMQSNINVVNGCSTIGKILLNSSGNTGNAISNQIKAGEPVFLHQVCLAIPTNEWVTMEEDPVTDLTTSIDVGNGMFSTEFPSFEPATFKGIRYIQTEQTVFLDFKGVPGGDLVTRLDWSTSGGEDVESYVVERSFDGKVFEAIGKVDGDGEDEGISSYQFVDRNAQTGSNFYRLRQIDNGGTENFSIVRKIVFDKYPFAVMASPNPARDKLYLQISHPKENGLVTLLDVSGKERLNVSFGFNQPNLELELNTLESGIYTLRVSSGTDVYTEKVVVIK